MHDAHVIGVDVAEAAVRRIGFVPLAMQQRDLLAVFARPREPEAEIGLEPLLHEIEIDQRAPDPVSKRRAGAGIDERNPEQKPGTTIARPGSVKPEDNDHSTSA